MNYIKQLNGFWALAESKNLKSTEIAVYMALIHYNNKLNWIDPFVAHYHIICQFANVSKNAYYHSMKSLHNKRFIDYQKGVRNFITPKVSIINLENRKGIIVIQDDEQDSELIKEQFENLYKQLNKQIIKLLNRHPDLINQNLENWIENSLSKNTDSNMRKNKILIIGDYKEELLNDVELKNYISKCNSLSLHDCDLIMKEFIDGLVATKSQYNKYSDLASHFRHWVVKYKENYLNNKRRKSSAKLLGGA